VRALREEVLERLRARFARAVADGEIVVRADLRALALFVQSVQNGMSILARDGATRTELERVARVAMKGWESIVRS
jgi:hypothetical protein